MNLTEVLHGIGTLLEDTALGGGSNLGLSKGAALVHLVADAIAAGEDAKPQLEQLAADIKVLVDNHGNAPKGHWEAILEKAKDVQKILADAQAVAVAVKTSKTKKAKGSPPPPSDPTDGAPNDAPQDPQP